MENVTIMFLFPEIQFPHALNISSFAVQDERHFQCNKNHSLLCEKIPLTRFANKKFHLLSKKVEQ